MGFEIESFDFYLFLNFIEEWKMFTLDICESTNYGATFIDFFNKKTWPSYQTSLMILKNLGDKRHPYRVGEKECSIWTWDEGETHGQKMHIQWASIYT